MCRMCNGIYTLVIAAVNDKGMSKNKTPPGLTGRCFVFYLTPILFDDRYLPLHRRMQVTMIPDDPYLLKCKTI